MNDHCRQCPNHLSSDPSQRRASGLCRNCETGFKGNEHIRERLAAIEAMIPRVTANRATEHARGTPGKIAVLCKRFEAGLPLWFPGDRVDEGDGPCP